MNTRLSIPNLVARDPLSAPLGASADLDDAPPDILKIWRAIARYKWHVLAAGVSAGALAFVIVSLMTPMYRSTAGVLIESNRPKVTTIEDVVSVSGGREHFQTQAEMLRSRDVAVRVIKQFKLDTHPDFDPRAGGLLSRALGMLGLQRDAMSPGDVEDAVVRQFTSQMRVEPVLLSNIMRVTFEASDPALAAAIANATIESYVRSEMENRYRLTQNAGSWITERLADLKAKLDASEQALQKYRDSEGLIDSKSTPLSGSGRQFEELSQKLVEARVRRSEAEEAYNQVRAGEGKGYESVPAVVRNTLVQRAKEAEGEAERRLAEVAGRFGPAHPAYTAAQSELNAARGNVERQTQAVVNSVLKEFNAARATEKTIEDALARSKGAIQALNRKDIQLGQLEREAASNRQIYQTFLSRYKETAATGDLQMPSARLVDVAVPSAQPARPAKVFAVISSMVGGLLLGVVAVLFYQRINNTIRNADDVEGKLHQPLLASLPVLELGAAGIAARETIDRPDSMYSEAVRTVSTGVLLSSLDAPRKVVVITSSVAGEGKSTFALNYGVSQAHSHSVVLVEADLRRPSIGGLLNLQDGQLGLSEVLGGACSLDEALLRVDGTNLCALAAGRIPPNPLAMLSSQRFAELLGVLTERFDFVVIDAPPLQPVSDALVLGRYATGIVYVVKSEVTPVPLAAKGLKRIVSAGLPIFGVVLNQHDFVRAERYYGEYSGYSKYGYGANPAAT